MGLKSALGAAAASLTVAAAGHCAGALTFRGALAATVVGTGVLGRFRGRGALLVGWFFGSGSSLNRLPASRSQAGGRVERDERQVFANGATASATGVLAPVVGHERAVAMLAGSLAAATSDTWATEIGLHFGGAPRYVLSGRSVPPGVSGGVTRAGTLASVAGAGTMALLACIAFRDARLLPVALAGGMSGSILDSVLGETLQAKWRSPVSQKLTEAAREDGRPATHVSGSRWVDNDVVNLACTASGGVVALALWHAAWER